MTCHVLLQNDAAAANSKIRKAKDLREQMSGLQYKLETAQTAAAELAKLGDNGAKSGNSPPQETLWLCHQQCTRNLCGKTHAPDSQLSSTPALCPNHCHA